MTENILKFPLFYLLNMEIYLELKIQNILNFHSLNFLLQKIKSGNFKKIFCHAKPYFYTYTMENTTPVRPINLKVLLLNVHFTKKNQMTDVSNQKVCNLKITNIYIDSDVRANKYSNIYYTNMNVQKYFDQANSRYVLVGI